MFTFRNPSCHRTSHISAFPTVYIFKLNRLTRYQRWRDLELERNNILLSENQLTSLNVKISLLMAGRKPFMLHHALSPNCSVKERRIVTRRGICLIFYTRNSKVLNFFLRNVRKSRHFGQQLRMEDVLFKSLLKKMSVFLLSLSPNKFCDKFNV